MGELYCLDNARTTEQRAKMMVLEHRNICIFCHPEECGLEVIYREKEIYVCRNQFPRPQFLPEKQVLIVPRRHVTDVSDISMYHLARMCSDIPKTQTKSYELRIRSGDAAKVGSTVQHLHIHLVDCS